MRDAQARKELAQVAQARGEELLRGASVFLRDAVRVVPPPEDEQAASSDSKSHSASASAAPPFASHGATPNSRGKAKAAAGAGTGAAPPPVAVPSTTPATRRGALLRALREYPAILRIDPASEERSAALFALWVGQVGEEGASHDEAQRESELGADDGLLRSTHSALGECCRLASSVG